MTTSKSAVSSTTGTQNRNPSSWDPQDDVLLRHLKEVKKLGWKEIAQYFKNRTPNACQFRWRRLKSGNLKTAKAGDATNGGAVEEVAASAVPTPVAATPVVAIPIPRQVNAVLPVGGSPGVLSGGSYPSPHVSLVGSAGNAHAGAGKFIKPRSYSHTVTPSTSFTSAHILVSETGKTEEENLGLIPKVIVRSRRGSVAQQTAAPGSSEVGHSNLSLALNTTLNSSKSRKNSFSSRSRRSSFNVGGPERIFGTPSRRSSVIQAPSSVASLTRRESFNSSTSRRGSVIQVRRESVATHQPDRRESLSQYTDVPKSHVSHVAPAHGSSLQQVPYTQVVQEAEVWLEDEDSLLSQRHEKHLSMDELSILLPHRSEQEIQWRINILDKGSPSSSSTSPLNSPERSMTEDTAIDEDNTEEDPQRNSQTPFRVIKEISPSLSSSSGSNGRDHSPVFSSHEKDRDHSPVVSDGTTRASTVIHQPNVAPRLKYVLSSQDHHHHHHTINNNVAAATQGAPLPSLNSLFKNIL